MKTKDKLPKTQTVIILTEQQVQKLIEGLVKPLRP
jgi:hypothetical protein